MVNWNGQQAKTANDVFASALYVAFSLSIGIWLLWDAAFFRLVTYAPYADYWEHTAVFTEWLRNFSSPDNPHVADPSLSSRYMPYYWALTFLGLLFQYDAVELMAISGVINYVLIVVGLRLFLNKYFSDPWAPVAGFFVIFMFWGVSWNWSNLYHLKSFFYVAGFPSSFVFGLSLISFYLVLKLLRSDGSALLSSALLCVLSMLMFLCHPLTAVFGIAGCGLLAITQAADSFNRRLMVLALLAGGTVLAEAWPYFSAWKIALGMYGSGMEKWGAGETLGPLDRFRSGAWEHIFYNPRLIITILGPTLLGIPLCLWLWRRREHAFIVLGAVMMSVPYFVHFFFEVPLAHRFLLFVVFFLQLAVVWAILQVIDSWRSLPRPDNAGVALAAVIGAMVIITGINIWMVALEFDGRTLNPKTLQVIKRPTGLPADMSVVDLYAGLTDPLEDTAIVLTTPQLGWPLPTVKGKVVSLFHENPMLEDQGERYRATYEFFYAPLSDGSRSAVANRYDVSHVLTSYGDKAITRDVYSWLGEHARLVATLGNFRMYKLLPSAFAAEPDPAESTEEPILIVAPATNAAEDESAEDPAPETASQLPASPAPAVEAAESEQLEESSGFGAPIGEPIVSPKAEPAAAPTRESLTEELPPELLAPRAEPDTDAPAEVLEEPEVFGAPIAAPVLDPEKHGG